MPLEPGPQVPAQPPQPRVLQTAREVVAWVVAQDATGARVPDPVSVPSTVVAWIGRVFQMRAGRALN